MKTPLAFLLLLSINLFWQNQALAFCSEGANYCHTRFSGNVPSKYCDQRLIPSAYTRNFHFDSSWQLLCNANADHFIRRPQKYDFNKWVDMKEHDPEGAFNYRRSLPKIEWSGQIPYQTIETWEWEECSIDSNAYKCGTKEVCHDESRSSCTTDNKGKQSCRRWTERVCHDVACSCWYDHTRTESLHCSNETMSFNSTFNRPSPTEWNAKKAPLEAVFLPNKYDLLPGETEDVQVFNNSNTSTRLIPKMEVGNAWNKYHANITGSGMGAACRMNNPTSIIVEIITDERDRTKASPNPFVIAENQYGEKYETIKAWDTRTDAKTAQEQKMKPKSIQLMDSAAALTQAIAEQSRRNADREILKDTLGQGENPDGMTLAEAAETSTTASDNKASGEAAAKGFFKNTRVRLQLKKINKWWWPDDWELNKKYSDDGESIVPSLNVFSPKQDVANSDMWVIDLMGDGPEANNNFYRHQKLIPDRKYKILVSVYQKGVPFYQQDCDTNHVGWRCNGFVRFLGLGIGENDYFSKPLEIPFATEPGYDERPYITGLNFADVNQGIPYLRWLYKPQLLFEKMVSEKGH